MAPYQDAQPFPGVRTLRVDGTDNYDSTTETIIALPSVLPVIRPDGTQESDPALMTGLGEYSLWITDDDLRALVDAGKMEMRVKWDELDVDDGRDRKSYRALYIHFVYRKKVEVYTPPGRLSERFLDRPADRSRGGRDKEAQSDRFLIARPTKVPCSAKNWLV